MGFKVGLHTAGPYPARLSRLLPNLDWVGLDVKGRGGDFDLADLERLAPHFGKIELRG